MYVQQLNIADLRAFKSAKVDLLYPGRDQDPAFADVARWPPRLDNVTVFLGNNGSGKSTVLDAVALALMSPVVASSGYRPQSLIRRSNRGTIKQTTVSADIVLHKQDGWPAGGSMTLGTIVETRGDIEFLRPTNQLEDSLYYGENNSAFFFVGYGASRRTEAVSASDLGVRRRQRAVRYERVASLFEDHFALTPLSSWLPAWQSENPGRYKQVIRLVNQLLPSNVAMTEEMHGGEYLFKFNTLTVPFLSLSDGYRTYIGWIGDLLYHVCMGAPSGARLVESRGVVMVDEIDLHVHPAWQRTLIPTLAKALPRLQFILTTHSPLVVGTLERANLYFVKMGRGSIPSITRPEEETLGLSADQVLRSEVFGLDSTRDPEFAAKLRTLSEAAQNGEAGAAVAFLRSASAGAAESPPKPEDAPEWLKHFSERAGLKK